MILPWPRAYAQLIISVNILSIVCKNISDQAIAYKNWGARHESLTSSSTKATYANFDRMWPSQLGAAAIIKLVTMFPLSPKVI